LCACVFVWTPPLLVLEQSPSQKHPHSVNRLGPCRWDWGTSSGSHWDNITEINIIHIFYPPMQFPHFFIKNNEKTSLKCLLYFLSLIKAALIEHLLLCLAYKVVTHLYAILPCLLHGCHDNIFPFKCQVNCGRVHSNTVLL
jgi:hypothetical protein